MASSADKSASSLGADPSAATQEDSTWSRRVLVLPEEAYCPMSTRIDRSGKFAKWSTNFWGYSYACQSVHGHNCWGSIKNTEAYKSLPPLR